MAARSGQIRTQAHGRSTEPNAGRIKQELLRRRRWHERAIAELDELLGALNGELPAKAITAPFPPTGLVRGRVVQGGVPHPPLSDRAAAAALDTIVAAVSDAYGVTAAQLKSPSRAAPIVHARAVAMFLAHELAGCLLVQIGSYFGGRDHSTVLYALRKARQARSIDPKIDRLVAALRG